MSKPVLQSRTAMLALLWLHLLVAGQAFSDLLPSHHLSTCSCSLVLSYPALVTTTIESQLYFWNIQYYKFKYTFVSLMS